MQISLPKVVKSAIKGISADSKRAAIGATRRKAKGALRTCYLGRVSIRLPTPIGPGAILTTTLGLNYILLGVSLCTVPAAVNHCFYAQTYSYLVTQLLREKTRIVATTSGPVRCSLLTRWITEERRSKWAGRLHHSAPAHRQIGKVPNLAQYLSRSANDVSFPSAFHASPFEPALGAG